MSALTEAERETLSVLCEGEAVQRDSSVQGYCTRHYAPVNWQGRANANEVCCTEVVEAVETLLADREARSRKDGAA